MTQAILTRAQQMILGVMLFLLGAAAGFLMGINQPADRVPASAAVAAEPGSGATEAGGSQSARHTIPLEWRDARGRSVLVEFYASWCPTCQFMGPHFQKLTHTMANRLHGLKLDIDDPKAQPYFARFGVRSTPTYLLFNPQGKLVFRSGDQLSPTYLRDSVQQALDAD